MNDVTSKVQSILNKYEYDEQFKKYNKMMYDMEQTGLISRPMYPMRDERQIRPNVISQKEIFSMQMKWFL